MPSNNRDFRFTATRLNLRMRFFYHCARYMWSARLRYRRRNTKKARSVHLGVVGWAKLLLKLLHAVGDGIEKALVLLEARRPRGRVRTIARAKEPLEYRAWIVFGHQRQRRRQPGERAAYRRSYSRGRRSPIRLLLSTVSCSGSPSLSLTI
jgi:hypothetical protein